MTQSFKQLTGRQRQDAGIALGPIIFIIAILAILAAAIAAGSGSFNASTNTEGNRTKASGLIQQGENLKIGMDRLTMENGVAWGGWNINTTGTVNTTDLFAPAGGGISAPSIALAGNAQGDVWYYPMANINGLGTTADKQLAVLNTTQGICQEINNRANGSATAPGIDAGGTMKTNGDLTTKISVNMTSASVLYGKPVGCLQNTNAADGNYYFYQVLFIQ
ncbi:MAG: hypothetical protein JO126_06800 [Alphaproteobacteria bacterium]|nr:hypothetical protein [Alphaproteobacteria bacterium]MBV8549147.1 hypothetical protein [Alphaproteobacteria bacterium]